MKNLKSYAAYCLTSLAVLCSGSLWAQKERVFELTNLIPESRAVFDLPSVTGCDPQRETMCILYALPNGNTIEWTAGKELQEGDDWHYDIQHIAAQTRFLRRADTSHHYVVVYLQAGMRAWTAYAAKYPDSPQLFNSLFNQIEQTLRDSLGAGLSPGRLSFTLNGHSGGGRFIFDLLRSFEQIPGNIERIAFIDSNYGYETDLFGHKLTQWLSGAPDRILCVLAYDDLAVRIDGKPIVSPLGGTGYRAQMMYHDLNPFFPMQTRADTAFVRHQALDGRVLVAIKQNPEGKIYHTVLVERNGFIHTMLMATPLEEKGYAFWGDRAYQSYIDKLEFKIYNSSVK